MPKGYIVARLTVSDPEAYKDYVAAASVAMKKFGVRVLARGGRYEALEGEARPRNVILEFASYDDVRRYYDSPEYQLAIQKRLGIAEGELVAVEGWEAV